MLQLWSNTDMEGLPAGDIQAKYQKLATEYSKVRDKLDTFRQFNFIV